MASICTYIATVVPHHSAADALRAQNSPVAIAAFFRFHRVYHLGLVRTSVHPTKVFFAQKVDFTNMTSAVSRPQLTRAITQLNVIEGYSVQLTATLNGRGSTAEHIA